MGCCIRTVPVRDPESLVRLRWAGRNQMATDTSDYGYTANDGAGQSVRTTFSYPMYQQFVKDNQTMSELVRLRAGRSRQRRRQRAGGNRHVVRIDRATTTGCSASTRRSVA